MLPFSLPSAYKISWERQSDAAEVGNIAAEVSRHTAVSNKELDQKEMKSSKSKNFTNCLDFKVQISHHREITKCCLSKSAL